MSNNKQSGRSGLGLSNFMLTKHAHKHFDLIIHIDIKTSKNENFFNMTIYCLDQEDMHILLSSLGSWKY